MEAVTSAYLHVGDLGLELLGLARALEVGLALGAEHLQPGASR